MNLKFSVIIALCILFLNLNCKNNINVPDKKIEKEDIPEVKVRAFVDKPEIPPFSRIKYTLIVNTKPGVKISIPEIGSLFKGLDVVDMGEDKPKKQEGRVIYKKWYMLLANDIGSYVIPKVKILYWDEEKNKKEIFTKKIFVEVKSSIKDGKDIKDIIGIKPIEKIKFRTNRVLILSILGILLILSAAVFIYYHYKRKRDISTPPISPYEIARMDLEKLKKSGLLESKSFKEYYFRLSEILRQYLEKRFLFPAKERTTEEIFKDIQTINDIKENHKFSLKDFLIRSDRIKFAKTNPIDRDIEKDNKLIEDVLDNSKPCPDIKDV